MAYLNRHWVSMRASTGSTGRGSFFSVLLAGLLCVPHAFLQAAPVTFRFDAIVADGTDVPFSVFQGDVIEVALSFEPGSPGPVYPQLSGMRFKLSGMNLEAQEFEIRVANNQNIDIPGRIADPDNTPDVDINEIGDSIVVSCRSGQLFCGSIEGSDGFVFRPLLVFSEQPSLLDSSELVADEGLWNAFSLREMSLLFQSLETGQTTYIGAYVGQVNQVPEPSTLLIVLGLTCVILIYTVRARLRISHTSLRKFHS